MSVTTAPDQAAMLRLEQIQHEMAALITAGALQPKQREQSAHRVVELRREAEAIAANPGSYRTPEPWQIEDEQQRRRITALTVNTVFSSAPSDDRLTDALVASWIQSLDLTASRQDRQKYEKECRQMRADADLARRLRPKPCPYRLPAPPDNPTEFLSKLQLLTEQTRQSIADNRRKPTEPWRRAAFWALDALETDAAWLQHHTGSRPEAHAVAQCLELARRFNEIHYAANSR